MSTFSPYTVIIQLPAAVLKQGANQLSFNTVASSVHNIHVELDFNAAAEPAYTPPAQVIGGAVVPAIPAVGPNAVMTRIGTKQVDTYMGNLNDPAIFNPTVTVSEVVPISVAVHQDIALQSTGSNVGVRQIELLIDKYELLIGARVTSLREELVGIAQCCIFGAKGLLRQFVELACGRRSGLRRLWVSIQPLSVQV